MVDATVSMGPSLCSVTALFRDRMEFERSGNGMLI